MTTLCLVTMMLLLTTCTILTSYPPTLDELWERMDALTVSYPGLTAVRTIGTVTADHLPIRAIVIAAAADDAALIRPKILVTGGIHGNEPAGVEIALRLAEHLAAAYGDEQTITSLLDGVEIHIIPVINPWGYDRRTRKNATGIDINRDFGLPDPDLSEGDDPDWLRPWTGGFLSEEAIVLRDLCESEGYLFSLQGHAGAECLSLPIDYLALPAAEEEHPAFILTYLPIYPLFTAYGQVFTDAVRSAGMEDFYMIEGGDWYIAEGTMTDWMYGALGAPGFTIEYTETKLPAAGESFDMNTLWNIYRDPLVDLVGMACYRMSGFVLDGSNDPVSAIVQVLEIEPERSSRAPGDPTPITIAKRTDPATGRYDLLIPFSSGGSTWRVTVTPDPPTEGSGTLQLYEGDLTFTIPDDLPILQDFTLTSTP